MTADMLVLGGLGTSVVWSNDQSERTTWVNKILKGPKTILFSVIFKLEFTLGIMEKISIER